MKKLMILAVVAFLLGISAPNYAQVPSSSQGTTTQPDEGDDLNTQPSAQPTSPSTSPSPTPSTTPSTAPATQPGSTMGTESKYSVEVKSADLPAAVTRSINEKYPGFKAEKAYRATDGTYKVKVSKDDEKQTLFFDERGESVKMQK
jgi:hypothetical protein